AKSGDQKGIINLHFVMWFVHYALYALIPFFAVLFGADVVKSVLDNIPEVIMNGLTVAGNLLPAVGMAMLLRMLWSKNIAVWFFFGAVVMAYLELPLIAIAAVGTIIAIVIAQRDLQLKNISVHAVQSDAAVNATLDQEEEDFFQ
ncbi:TPA: PTS sugar transporter subunit IIC, partial [Enterococcus faecium]|nr:PTS sugar transporter subunit IIC [Enterococcus faecium]